MVISSKRRFGPLKVLVILLLLAGFGGWRYVRLVKKQQTRTKRAALYTMLENYKTKIGEYPTTLQELIDGPSNPELKQKWGGALATRDDLTDGWKNFFSYIRYAEGSQPPYELKSLGSKGAFLFKWLN